MKIQYSSNNSGGSWWLTDDHWRALEEAGWTVEWGRPYFCRSKYYTVPAGFIEPCEEESKCPGHRVAESYEEALKIERFLGAMASSAFKDFGSARDAILEFERITGQSASDEGCNCCGPPHSFSWRDEEGRYDYASGDDVVRMLYDRVPSSLREAARLLNGGDDR